jgi:hypothetical protein
MRVGRQGEASVPVSEVLGHRLDALASVQEHRREVVPQRVRAVLAGRPGDTGPPPGRVPHRRGGEPHGFLAFPTPA